MKLERIVYVILCKAKNDVKRIKHRWILCSALILLFSLQHTTGIGQNEIDTMAVEEPEFKRPTFLDISFGLSVSSFRDFATSPLTYTGTPLYVALSHIDIDDKRVSAITGSYSFGKFKNTTNNHTSESEVNTISVNYIELFQVQKWEYSKAQSKNRWPV